MFLTIDEYKKNKRKILETSRGSASSDSLGNVYFSPMGLSKVIGVSCLNIVKVISNDFSVIFEDSMTITQEHNIQDLKDFGISDLDCIYYIEQYLLYVFVMKNKKAFKLELCSVSKDKMNNLLSIFEELKIEELKDRESWIPIYSRLEILDL